MLAWYRAKTVHMGDAMSSGDEFRDHPDAIIELTRRDLEDIIEGAARRGAEQALKEVGLDTTSAGDDVRELRSLLNAFRSVKSTALDTIVKSLTMTFLLILGIGVSAKLGLFGGLPKP